MRKADWSVAGRDYWAEVMLLDQGVLLSNRHVWFARQEVVETYGPNGCLALAHAQPGDLALGLEGEWISLEGGVVVVIPPFGVVRWRLGTCPRPVSWTAIMTTRLVSPRGAPIWPRDVCFLSHLPHVHLPTTWSHALEWIDRVSREGRRVVSSGGPAVANKLKNYLDAHYQGLESQMCQAAAALKCSRVVLSRAFTRQYGLTPKEYRHRMRVFAALSSMNEGVPVTEAALEAGYTDPGQLGRQFHRYLQVSPRDYQAPKTGRASRGADMPQCLVPR